MNDTQIRDHIEALIAEEHRLLEHGERAALTPVDAERLHSIEVQLDQFWDLLRQRRVCRDARQDPGATNLRPADVVERYQQ
ncbi:MAG TPA: DUF2630 family protein [Candidatus Tyrphobacter sp.]